MSEVLNGEVLLLQEVPLHPNSVMKSLEPRFEKPSIVRVAKRDALRSYQKPPIFDDKYLVIFEDKKVFEGNVAFLRLQFMFPVVLCPNKGALTDVIDLCKEKHLPYRVYVNKFEKADAIDLIQSLASEKVSHTFCETLIRRVGLSPKRILSAVMVCEQVGYTTSNVSKYIDKYTYIDIYDVVETLLGICRSNAQRKRAAVYLHTNRLWYRRYTQPQLVKELELMIKIYQDLIGGKLTPYSVQAYIESEKVPKYRVLYTVDLYSRISLIELLSLKQFLSQATILEVAMRIA